MSLPRYENYKDSGVEWIGEIPDGWDVKKLKYVAEMKSGESITSDQIKESGDFPVYGGNGSRGYFDSFTHEGDYVLIGRQGALCGNINYAAGKFWASEHAIVCTLARFNVTKWFGELLLAMNLNQYSVSAAQPGLSIENIKILQIPVPPSSEQTVIASFLDRKTAELDQLIAKKEELITLYEEEKTSIINLAVTRGVDPHVKLKPSGVDWLGDIPEHWEAKKIKFLLKQNKGALKTGPFGSQLKTLDLSISGEYKVYTQRNVLDNNYSKGDDKIDEDKFESLKEFEIISGDILLTTRGTIGKCSIFPEDAVKGILHPCLIRIQIDEGKLNPNYIINYFNNSSFFLENVKLESNSTVIDVIYGYTLKEIIIPLPPVTEQSAIVAHIETEYSRLNTIIYKFKKQIDLFKEYRTTLISDVVTGKIDVRGEVAA